MSVLIQPNGNKLLKEQTKFGVDTKKMERTGKDTFVVHGSGGNHFEGKITNPKIKFKESGRLTFTGIGICLKKCLNRDKECTKCVRFSKLKEESYASS